LRAIKVTHKGMLPIVDKPTLQLVVEVIVAAGIEDHFNRAIELENLLAAEGAKGKEKELDQIKKISSLANIIYVRQKEPLGFDHAVLCAHEFVGSEPFDGLLDDDIIHAEVPVIGQLIKYLTKKLYSWSDKV
jgi:UTP--glucose-1-phosphate uridylyltransferase